MTRLGCVHDKDVHATEEFCHDRDFSIATDLNSDEKKKNPRGLGRHITSKSLGSNGLILCSTDFGFSTKFSFSNC